MRAASLDIERSERLEVEPVPANTRVRAGVTNRILFIDQYASVSGGQRSLIALVKVALSAGHAVSVMAPTTGAFGQLLKTTFNSEITLRNIPEILLTSDRKRYRDYFKYLAYSTRFLAQWRYISQHDIVYVNGSRAFLPSHIISHGLGRRFIFHVRLDHKPAEKRLISMIARSPRTYRVISNSEFNTDQLRQFDNRLTACNRLATIENALYPPYDSLTFRSRFGDSSGRLTFGVFGRISPEKGHALLPALAREFPNSRFVLIGHCTSENQSFLDDILTRCPGNCEYAGFHSDLPLAVEQYGVQVSLVPSLWNESFGLAAIESMAMSCLTAVSDTGMLPRLAARTGAFVFAGQTELLALCQQLHRSPTAELSMRAEEQHRAALRCFGFDRFSREVSSLLS